MDSRGIIQSIFGSPRALIGCVHVGALPGTPSHQQSIEKIAERAVEEARMYAAAGYDGIAIENTHRSAGPRDGACIRAAPRGRARSDIDITGLKT